MYNKFIVGDIVEIDEKLFIILAVYLPAGSIPYYYLTSEDKNIEFIYTSPELSKIITKHIRNHQYNNELYCNNCDLKQLVDENCSKYCNNSYKSVKDYYFIGDEVTLNVMSPGHLTTDSTIIAVYLNINFYCGEYSSNCFNLYFIYNYKLEEFNRTSRNFLKHYTKLDLGPLFKGDSILPYLSFCYRQRKQDPLDTVNKRIYLKKRRGFTINPNFNPCELCCGLVNCWSCKNKKYDD